MAFTKGSKQRTKPGTKQEIKRTGPTKDRFKKPSSKGKPQQYQRREFSTKSNMTHDEMVTIWEKMRVKKLSPPERLRYINSVIGYFVDNVVSFSRKPVEVRVLRFIVKHGADEHRSMILKEINNHVQELIIDKYATKLIERLGGSYRWDKSTSLEIVDQLLPNIQKLCLNTVGATTISYIYQTLPLKMQNKMLMALLGPVIDIRDSTLIAREIYILKEALYVPGRFSAVFAECIRILQKAMAKDLLGCTLITKLVADTLRMIFGCFESTVKSTNHSVGENNIDGVTEPVLKKPAPLQNINETTLQFISELTSSLLENNAFLSLMDTADSVFVSSFILQFCTAKNRKEVVKAIRPHVVQFASDPMAFIVLCKLFSVTDDTVTTISSLIAGEGGIGSSLNIILRSRAGIRTVHFLLFGLEELDASGKGTSILFAKWISEILRQTNLAIVFPNATPEMFPGLCKKDSKTKQAELRNGILPFLLDSLMNKDLLVSLLGSCEIGSQMLCELITYLQDADISPLEAPKKFKSSKKDKPATNADPKRGLKDLLEAIAQAACKLVDTTVKGIRQSDKDLLHQGTHNNIMKTIAKQQKKALEAAQKEKEKEQPQDNAETSSSDSCSDSDEDDSSKPTQKPQKHGEEAATKSKRNVPYVPCAPEEMQPLFRHDVGYFSVRRILTNHPMFGSILLSEFKNQSVPAHFFSDKRGAFMLEHIAKTNDANRTLVRNFITEIKIANTLAERRCKGSEALCAALGL